jgi:hypothetical protein
MLPELVGHTRDGRERLGELAVEDLARSSRPGGVRLACEQGPAYDVQCLQRATDALGTRRGRAAQCAEQVDIHADVVPLEHIAAVTRGQRRAPATDESEPLAQNADVALQRAEVGRRR